ncbi:MAG: DUF2190 family protein [Devosia sp.]
MATNFIQTGDIIEITAAAAVSSGDGVLIGTLFGVAVADAAIGAQVNLNTTGVWTLPKTSAQAWTVGAAIYWDGTACTTTVSTNVLIGKAVAVAANPSATGVVRLNG